MAIKVALDCSKKNMGFFVSVEKHFAMLECESDLHAIGVPDLHGPKVQIIYYPTEI